MFKKLTKFIVNQMDPYKELDPVESIVHNEHFRPLCLLTRKRKSDRMFHRAPYYQRTGFTLDDVLLPGEDGKSIESLHQESSPFTLTKVSTDQADGGLSISLDPASVELKGGASFSKGFSIKPQKKSVPMQSLEALKRESWAEEREKITQKVHELTSGPLESTQMAKQAQHKGTKKINMDHSLIQQLQRKGIRLYLVTEILEASEEAVCKESSQADGGFMAKFYATLSAKGSRENNQGIVIPKGCTLAFRSIHLHIEDGEWDVEYLPVRCMGSIVQQGALTGKLGEMGREVEICCQIFSKLSPDLQLIIFNTIKAVMRDKNLLQELSQKMEEVLEQNDGYELKTESPDLKDLFSTLQHSPGDRLLLLAEGITYVLDALHELTEDQLLLLLESLERKIVSQQLNLFADLLKPNLQFGNEPFFVDPGLLSFPHKEEQMLTMELVELSGVELQEDGSAVPKDEPFEAVAAVLVALYTLSLLSGSE